MGSHPRRWVIALPLVLALGGIVVWLLSRPQPTAGELVLYGNVDIRQVRLAFNGSERINTLLVHEGDPVKRDQLLGALDTRRLEQTVARAEAELEAQNQVVARLEAGARPEEISKARADVAAAEAEAQNAQREYERRVVLFGEGASTQQQRDDARAVADAAQARLKAVEEALALAVAGPRKEDIAAARATRDARAAELAFARRQFADANLYAPSDGVIQDRILEPGDMASPQTPVYTLALCDPVWVRAHVSESDLGKVQPGMAAVVATDSFPGKRYEAWVGHISPTAEFTPKSVETTEIRTSLTYQVRVYVRNPQNELRLGMPATVLIPLTPASAAGGSAK